MTDQNLSVGITMGAGKLIGMDQDDNLVLVIDHDKGERDFIDLGLATTKRIEEIQSYLERLKIYTIN